MNESNLAPAKKVRKPISLNWRDLSLQTRLTALVLVALVPLLIGVTAIIIYRAGTEIEKQANIAIQKKDDALATNVSTWLELHVRTLQEMASLPDITSMDSVRQRLTLLAIANAHPNLFLVQTTDLSGINVARNDAEDPKDYHDRVWFLGAKSGEPITFEVLISRTTGKPALNMSTPIRSTTGTVIGVASIVSELDEISLEVLKSEEGRGITFIIDANNHVVAHPDPTYTEKELRDLSTYPPVVALRQGETGLITFTDENGEIWRAYAKTLDNGWAVIAQQPIAELLAPMRDFQKSAIIFITLGTVVMLILAWWVIRRMLQPIGALTDAVSAISAGDLNRVADVNSQDEIGILASSFNSMTAQLRDLIGSLEQRVANRTKALATTTEVSRRLSTILNREELVAEVVNQVKNAFNYYHAHIYLLDEVSGDLIMAGGTGEAGEKMLAQGHKVSKGRGLVGRAAESNQAVLVSDTSQNPDWLPNPLLPETKSEVAIPISIGDEALGVLDVQQNVTGGLKQEDVDSLQSIANQVAIALQNARIFTQAEQQRHQNDLILGSAGEGIFGLDKQGNHTFVNTAGAGMLGYSVEELIGKHSHTTWHHTHADGTPFPGEECPIYFTLKDGTIHQGEEYFIRKDGSGFYVNFSSVPIQEEGRIVGAVVSFTDITQQKREREFIAQRAKQQEALNLITQRIQNTTSVEAALQIAARELGHALGMKQTQVTLEPEVSRGANPAYDGERKSN